MRLLTILVAFTLTAFGQRHSLTEIKDDSPESKALQQITQADDEAKKTALLEQFASQFPKADATPWALEQLLGIYVKANQPDKTIAAGEKLLAVDPDHTEAALQCLKAAEARHDLEAVKKYSAQSSALARKMMAKPQPQNADDVENWKQEVSYATQVDTYGEYSLYRAGLEARDPKVVIEFGELLPQRYPKGQYTGKLDGALFLAYRQTSQDAKALAVAERVLATDQSNEDMLLVTADNYLQNKKEPEKVHAYCSKLVEIMASKPKPEGVADATWTSRKNTVVGLAHYMNGKLYFNENKFAQADQELRGALSFVESNPASKGEVLFLLGFSNYNLQKPQDAANFYRACSTVKSDYAAKAAKNLQVIRTEFTGIK